MYSLLSFVQEWAAAPIRHGKYREALSVGRIIAERVPEVWQEEKIAGILLRNPCHAVSLKLRFSSV
jgi:hypothetical protein